MSDHPQGTQTWVDAIATNFDRAWRAGQRPGIEDFLSDVAEPRRSQLLAELLRIDLEYRRKSGETLTPGEYENRFPAEASVVREVVRVLHSGESIDPRSATSQLGESSGPVELDRTPTLDPERTMARESIGRTLEPPAAPGRASGVPARETAQRFHVVRLHGKGGLGEVLLAHDGQLNRDVALKRIQERFADDPLSRARFLLEAEITGGLEHPGIVPVHALGHSGDGRPFYIMRFIKGESLKDAIQKFHESESTDQDPGRRRLVLRKLLNRFLDVCNAVAYAHSRGVIHRDLKPANVVLGKYGETLVVDWGLAKALGMEEADGEPDEPPVRPRTSAEQLATEPGSVLGTPAFMSPEQADGLLELLGPTSDVYSLGATLYTLLTGRVPYSGRDGIEVLEKARRGEFARPRAVNRSIAPGLEAICLKAMERDSRARYQTPKHLAEDIEHWLADEPVSAWCETWPERLARWSRRHRAWVRAGAAALVMIATVATLSAFAVQNALTGERRARKDEQEALEHEKDARKSERLALKKEQEQRSLAEDRRRQAQRLSARLVTERALTYLNNGDTERGIVWLAQALKLAPDDDRDFQRFLRLNLSAWGQRSHQLKATIPPVVDNPPSDNQVAVLGGRSILTAVRNAPPEVWDASTGRKLGRLPLDHGTILATSPTGRAVMTGWVDQSKVRGGAADTGGTRIWDLTKLEPIGPPLIDTPSLSPDGSDAPAFSFDGKYVAAISQPVRILVWDATTGKAVGKPLRPLPAGSGHTIEFSPDGTMVLARSHSPDEARVWDVATGRPLCTTAARRGHDGPIVKEVFQPGGALLATVGADATVRLWDSATGSPHGPPLEHPAHVTEMAFSPDGKSLLTLCVDGNGRLWEVETGALRGSLLPVPVSFRPPVFSPDGRAVAIVQDRDRLRLWEVSTGRPIGEPITIRDPRDSVLFSPDSRLVAANQGIGIGIWSTTTGKPAARPIEVVAQAAAFGAAGETLITLGQDGKLSFWRVADGAMIRSPLPTSDRLAGSCFDPRGRAVLSIAHGREARLHETATGKPLGPVMRHPDEIQGVAISPDSKTVLTWTSAGVRFWDGTTGRSPWVEDGSGRAEPGTGPPLNRGPQSGRTLQEGPRKPGEQGRFLAVAISPDGSVVATGSWEPLGPNSGDRGAWLWEARTGRIKAGPLLHEDKVRAVAFSPDGKTLVTASHDKNIRRWDVATGRQVAEPLAVEQPVWAVAFSPDGRTLAAGYGESSSGGKVGLWDASSGKPQATLATNGYIVNLMFTRDGRWLLAGDQVFELATMRPTIPRDAMFHQGDDPRNLRGLMALSPEGKTVVASVNSLVSIHERLTGRNLGLKFPGAVSLATFSPDGKVLLTADYSKTVWLWDATTGRQIGAPLPVPDALGEMVGARAAVFLADAKTVVTADGPKAMFWRLTESQLAAENARITDQLSAVALNNGHSSVKFSADGKRIVTRVLQGERTYVRLWDAATGSPAAPSITLENPPPDSRDVLVSSDARFILAKTGLHASTNARLWQTDTGRQVGAPLVSRMELIDAAFSPGGRTFATRAADGAVQLWNAATRQPIGKPRPGFPSTSGLSNPPHRHALRYSPDGKRVLSIVDLSLTLLDTATGELVGQPLILGEMFARTPLDRSCRFSPDGRSLLVLDPGRSPLIAGRTRDVIVQTDIGKVVPLGGRCTFPFAFNSDGRSLVTTARGGLDQPTEVAEDLARTAMLWDVDTVQPRGLPLKHLGRVTAVAFHPDGQSVVTGDANGEVRFWNAATGQPILSPLSHAGSIGSLDFAADRKTLLVATPSGISNWHALSLWGLGGSFRERVLSGPYYQGRFSPDGRFLVTTETLPRREDGGSSRSRDRLWDARSGRSIGPDGEIIQSDSSPDGKTALLLLSTGGRNDSAQLWDVVANRPIAPPWTVPGQPSLLAWRPDGKAVLVGDGERSAPGSKTAFRRLDVANPVIGGVPLRSLRLVNPADGHPIGPEIVLQTKAITQVAFVQGGSTILIVGEERDGRLYDLSTGQAVGPVLSGPSPVDSIHPRGDLYLDRSMRSTFRVWNVASREPLGPPIDNPDDKVPNLSSDSDGKSISGVGMIRRPNVQPAAQLSPDGKVLLTVHPDKHRIRLWDAATGKPIGSPDGPPTRDIFVNLERAGFAPGGKVIFGVWQTDNLFTQEVRIWEATSCRPLGSLTFRRDQGTPLAVHPDGKAVLVAQPGGRASLLAVDSQRPAGPTFLQRLPAHQVREFSLSRAVFSPDGTKLLTELLGLVQLWDVATGRPIGQPFPLPRTPGHSTGSAGGPSVAFSPDGKLLVVGGGTAIETPNFRRRQARINGRPAETIVPLPEKPLGVFQIYDTVTGLPVDGALPHPSKADHLVFSADGRTLVVASRDGTAQAWDVARRQARGPVLTHDGEIVALAPSPDGKTLLVREQRSELDRDSVAHHWDTVTGEPIGAILDRQGAILAQGFRLDGTPLVVGLARQTIRIRETKTRAPIGEPIPLAASAWPPSSPASLVRFGSKGVGILTFSGGSVQLWDARTGQPIGPTISSVNQVGFTPEGFLSIVKMDGGGDTSIATRWTSPTRWNSVAPPPAVVRSTAVELWSMETGERLGGMALTPGEGHLLAVAANARTALVAGRDGSVQIWDVPRGRLIGEPLSLAGPLTSAQFTPDSTILHTTARDGSERFWDTATAQVVGPPLPHASEAYYNDVVSPDGRTLVRFASSKRLFAELLDVPVPLAGTTEQIELWSQVTAGFALELEPIVSIRRLDPEATANLRRRLEAVGDPFVPRVKTPTTGP